jgi:drug/metabolite transporter (DMT)-like permease
MEVWFALAIIDAFLFGSDAIFAKLSTSKLGMTRIAILIAIIDGPIYLSGFYIWQANVAIELWGGLLATVSCVTGVIGYLCFFESLGEAQIAITGTISAAYPCLTVVGAILFLSETLTTTQAIGLVGTIGGILALSYERNHKSEHSLPRRSLLFALLAFALWGLWGLTSKMATDIIGPANVFGFYAASSLFVPTAYAMVRRTSPADEKITTASFSAWLFGATSVAFNAVGVFAFTFAIFSGLASLVVSVTSVYPVVTVVMAVLLLREKLNKVQTMGLVVPLLGLMTIGISV